MSKLLLFRFSSRDANQTIMNPQTKLLAWIAITTGTIGFSSLAIANLTNHNRSNSTIAQNGGMNHSGMKSGEMNHHMDVGPADANYLNAMIPHHQGAVTMGQDLLKKSKRPEMKKLAQSIIKSQQIEINMMTQWQKEWSVAK
jgi:uncharacterized protein (DUF305 family)